MTRAVRKVHGQFVLTAMLVYLLMAIDFQPWAIKAVNKIQRGFLWWWRGRKNAHGGYCLVALEKTCGGGGGGRAPARRAGGEEEG
jgi:hypothetical protein